MPLDDVQADGNMKIQFQYYVGLLLVGLSLGKRGRRNKMKSLYRLE
ncbi:hypothetical protein ES708_11927 [subsurface metagenome]